MAAAASVPPIQLEIRHPLLVRLFEYWLALGHTDGKPLKSSFDPVNLPAALWPRLHMIDIPRDGGVCRSRLLGTYVAEAVGFDFTGSPLTDDAVPGMSDSVTYRLLDELRSTSEPRHYFGVSNFSGAARYATHEQILLPLYGEDGHMVAAVGALDYAGFAPGMFMHRQD